MTSVIILSGRIDQIQQDAGFTLSLFAALAVSCVIVLRIRRPTMARPFRTWGYPFTPLVFLGVTGWMMAWALLGTRWREACVGLLTVSIGGLGFVVLRRLRRGGRAAGA